MNRRSLLLAAPALTLARPTRAQIAGGRPIRMVVAYPPGGGTDLMARAVAQGLRTHLGQNVVVENRAGGNGTVGSLSVAQSRPDGTTLLFASGSELAVKPLLEADLPYDAVRDFAPIALMGITPVGVAVHPSVPASTMGEFIALAKAQPGKLNIANSGRGGVMHLTAAYLALRADINVVHVAYRGAAPAVADTVAGTTQAVVSGLPPLLPQAQEGRLRMLAVAVPRRSSALPDVPTLDEAGLTGFDMSNTVGIVARQGTPADILDAVNAAANRAIQDPEIRQVFVMNGAEPAGSTVEQYATFAQAERDRFRAVVRATGIAVQD
ncbi:tripartite tricarboxylate transporter substrate binding protein [Roseomonas terrae]|uniref:Tripartite tricarboxylate transporter substrate binding protein n=1 Tax=Neoroseomonas terrae TaxID=424799 RepID=A0ABS5ELW6_9PROT|nr:tripartite tricarboxylate transporter substrate binding protein [Neoroseomonas terrae]MBR0652022.1 tripartite tricarboxylate transporter substrate binding protein [Neoroseomonas terrae]